MISVYLLLDYPSDILKGCGGILCKVAYASIPFRRYYLHQTNSTDRFIERIMQSTCFYLLNINSLRLKVQSADRVGKFIAALRNFKERLLQAVSLILYLSLNSAKVNIERSHAFYSLISYFLMPSLSICAGINSFMLSIMVLSIRSLTKSFLMYRDMRL